MNKGEILMIIWLSFFCFIGIIIFFLCFLSVRIAISPFYMELSPHMKKTEYKIQIGLYIGDQKKLWQMEWTQETWRDRKQWKKWKGKLVRKFLGIEEWEEKTIQQAKEFEKRLPIRIGKTCLKISIGTQEADLTSMTIGILAGLIGGILPFFYHQKNWHFQEPIYFKTRPLYQNTIKLAIFFQTEIQISVVHMIQALIGGYRATKKARRNQMRKEMKRVRKRFEKSAA